MADKTRRWYGDSSVSYALAALALMEYARDNRVRYVFGPLDTASMLSGGLSVTGSDTALERAAEVLAGVPGLAQEEAAESDSRGP